MNSLEKCDSEKAKIKQLEGKTEEKDQNDGNFLKTVSASSLVWELILDRVEDSKDVLKVFKVFPELDIFYKNKKRMWLIGQVVHLLIKRFALEEKDILNSRLVCKQWKMRVDFALEMQSGLRAYDLERDKEEKDYWQEYDHWLVFDFQGSLERIFLNFKNKFLAGIVFFFGLTNLEDFLNDMQSCANPFVGRALTVVISKEVILIGGKSQNQERVFGRNLIRILERYGRQLWYLRLILDDFEEFCKELEPVRGIAHTILQILALVPNLKSLELETWREEDMFHSNPNLFPQLPNLPHLESIFTPFCTIPIGLIRPILTCYGSQLRKLEVAVGYWMEGMEGVFVNLTELQLNFVELEEESTSQSPNDLMPLIIAPNLVKLRIMGSQDKEISIESDIFKWLRNFPCLKYFNVGDCFADFELLEENLQGPVETFPSLEYLSFQDSGKLSFNFLRSFPSLRQLTMIISEEPLVTDLSILDSEIKLREELQTLKLYDSNIWKHLPKLYRVILYEIDLRETYRFSREQYEKMSRDKNEGNFGGFHKFRKYVQFYLEGNQMYNRNDYRE